MAVRVLWETETQRMEACDHEGTSETEGNLSKCTECGKVWPSSFKGVPRHRLVHLEDEDTEAA